MEPNKNLSLAEFQPAEAQLQELAAKAKLVDVKDIKAVHDARIELRDTRVALTKKGKELREGATAFAKAVIAKEKDLLSIIAAEEERLESVEEEAKLRAEIEKRRAELPSRLAALASIGDNEPFTEDSILAMDDNEFNAYRLGRIEAKLAEDKRRHEDAQRREAEDAAMRRQQEAEAAKAKLAAEKAAFDAEMKEKEAKVRAEQEALAVEKARLAGIEEQRQREEAAKNAETDRLEREAKLRAEKEAADRKAAEDEKARVEAEKAYQEWLASVGFDKSQGDIVLTSSDTVTAYRPIGFYKIKK